MRERAAEFLSEIGQISASHRELFMYLDRAKLRVDDHRVVYWTADGASGAIEIEHTIPYCNIAFLLLGPGCSVSTEAMELLSAANVVVGFTGDAASPLSAGVEAVSFACGQSEYRPTEYMQGWARWWFDEGTRIEKARQMLIWRAEMMDRVWRSQAMQRIYKERQIPPLDPSRFFAMNLPSSAGGSSSATHRGKASGLFASAVPSGRDVQGAIETLAAPGLYAKHHFSGASVEQLLGQEGDHVKRLYGFLARHAGIPVATRQPRGGDGVNPLLTMGNYIAYGLAAVALHGLGISFAFAILHGKTRRGALVFDVADPIKDAVVAPIAFACAKAGEDKDACRKIIKHALQDLRILSVTMDHLKSLSI